MTDDDEYDWTMDPATLDRRGQVLWWIMRLRDLGLTDLFLEEDFDTGRYHLRVRLPISPAAPSAPPQSAD